MPEEPPEHTPSGMDKAAEGLREIFSDPKVLSHASRYWLYDPERKVFYRDPLLVELEKMFDEILGIEHHDEDDAPRPAA